MGVLAEKRRRSEASAKRQAHPVHDSHRRRSSRVGHLRDTILYHLDYEPTDSNKILKSWSEFHSHVFKAYASSAQLLGQPRVVTNIRPTKFERWRLRDTVD